MANYLIRVVSGLVALMALGSFMGLTVFAAMGG